MILDAKDLIVGRFATVVAKQALLGEKIDIINCSEAYVTGRKKYTLTETKRRFDQGTFKGPFIPKVPDRYVRRIIRGMLPYKQQKGEEAFKRIMCYSNTPKEFEGKETTTIKEAHISKVPNLHYLKIKEICKNLGAKNA